MTYRELLEEIAERYGYWARDSWDGDMDVIIPREDRPKGLVGELQRVGFRVHVSGLVEPSEFFVELHVHSPIRSNPNVPDRGWDWEGGSYE